MMMESSSLDHKDLIKDVRNLFRLEKVKTDTIDTTIKGTKNLFRLEKENTAIKYLILKDIRNLFENKKKKIL